jgi:hypothetical protein
MYQLESILEVIEEILNTKRKRHITGGILISLAALFGGLAATALTIRPEEKENDDYE